MSTAYPTPDSTQPQSGPSQPEKKKKGGCMKWGGIALAIFIVLGIVGSCGGEDTENTETGASSTTAEPSLSKESETKTSEQEEPTESQQEESTAPSQSDEADVSSDGKVDAMEWLKYQNGGMEPTEVLMTDPTLWYGYVGGAYIEHDNLHVQLLVDRKEDKELGKTAAKALSNFVMMSDDPLVKDVDYAIAENGVGEHIAQERVRRLN